MKHAYVLFAVGQTYINKIQSLVEYLLRYSTNDVLLYYSEGAVDYSHPRLRCFYTAIPYLIDFNIPGHRPTAVRNLYLMTYKPDICKSAIQDTCYDGYLYMDSDVLPTPNIDLMVNKWSNQCTNFPLFSRYPTDNSYIDDRPLILDNVLSMLNIGRENKSIFELCAGFFFFNKNCHKFIDHWIQFVHSRKYTDYFTVPNSHNNHDLCHYSDEGAANALMWYYKHNDCIGPMVWTALGECVRYVLTYNPNVEQPIYHQEYNGRYVRTPNQYSEPYTRDISIFPLDKNEMFAFHGIKDSGEFNKGIAYINQLY